MVAFIKSLNVQMSKIDEHSALLKIQYTCHSGWVILDLCKTKIHY